VRREDGFDRDHADGLAARTRARDQHIGQRGFADTGRPGQADDVRTRRNAGGIEQVGQRVGIGLNLDRRKRARDRALVRRSSGSKVRGVLRPARDPRGADTASRRLTTRAISVRTPR